MQDLQKKWEATLLSLSFAYPFYAHLLYKVKLDFIDSATLTAKVNHKLHVKVGNKFASSLTQAEFSGVILHEVLHVVLGYHDRLKTREGVLFNIAHDYVVNGLVEEAQRHSFRNNKVVELADGCLLDACFSNMAAEEIYGLLSQKVDCTGGNRKLKLNCFDKSTGKQREVQVDLDDSGYDDVDQEELTETQIDQISLQMSQLLKEAEMQHKSQRGILSQSLQLLVDAQCKPRIYWKSFIRNYVGARASLPEPTYMRRSRRSEAIDEILPGWRKSSAANIVLLWDTSGSMQGMHQAILSEFRSLVREMGYSLRLIQCDAAVQSDTLLDDESVIVKGHGGSNFIPAFSLLEKESEEVYVISMTDGEILCPQEKPDCVKDVLWVYTKLHNSNYPRILFPYGDCIELNIREGTVKVLRQGVV